MSSTTRSPWQLRENPQDLAIATLALLILCLLLLRIDSGKGRFTPPSEKASIQARTTELIYLAKSVSVPGSRILLGGQTQQSSLLAKSDDPWDRALLSVLEAEDGHLEIAKTLALEGSLPPGKAGACFQRCWIAAYEHQGEAPSQQDLALVRSALRNGYAARMLEARLLEHSGGDPRLIREEAHRWARWKLSMLGLLGLIVAMLMAKRQSDSK